MTAYFCHCHVNQTKEENNEIPFILLHNDFSGVLGHSAKLSLHQSASGIFVGSPFCNDRQSTGHIGV